jgi:TolB-like protein
MSVSSRAVFLSYASQDAEPARRICEVLRAAGIEVWFDQSDLRGGEAWDRKIRREIKDCALFIAIISDNSQARLEGYFRREWHIAVDRTHDMADGKPFIVPVVIDGTKDTAAHVPESFHAVQWTWLPGGVATHAFVEQVAGLLPVDSPDAAASDPLPAATRSGGVPSSAETNLPAPAVRAKPGPRVRVIGVSAFIALSVLVLAGYLFEQRAAPVAPVTRQAPNSSAPIQVPPTRRLIAVLPFENLSPDPNNAFFTDGMHEEILTALANGVPDLDVISRTTMDTYKGKAVTVPTLAKELNCSYVLEGSMRRQGNDVRLTLQLIDARNDDHLWAQNFDGKLVNALALESEVAAAVASQLSIKLTSIARGPPQATNPAAFDLYLKARRIEENPGPGPLDGSLQNAKGLLDRAVASDPRFVRAYIERIVVRMTLFVDNFDSSEANIAATRRDLDVVKMLAPQDAVVIAADAILAYGELEFDRSLSLFQAAEAAGLADPHLLDWKASLLFEMARYDEDAALNQRLVALDPKNEEAVQRWWYVLMVSHLPEEGLRVADLAPTPEIRAALRLGVGVEFAGNLAPYEALAASKAAPSLDLVQALTYTRRFAEARQVIDSMPQKTTNEGGWGWPVSRVGPSPIADQRGWLDMLMGDAAAARRDGEVLARFLDSEPETRWNKWFRKLLRADAQLFSGGAKAAIATVDEALAMTRAGPDVSDQTNAFVWATQIRAWGGAQDEAVARLETLSRTIPGLPPGEFILPLWSVPLAKNAGYIRLRARLDPLMKTARFE